ncbi:MAG: hypothetical protein GXP61_10720 [Epsilonproteobacteria bacterium]|nr:hypothetical protein [Campylobacterota bacterium]
MRIENLLQITDGLLQNIPCVLQIESIKIDPLKINRGDLFIDVNNSLQNQALAYENGAYAIISENISQIIDNEIAWIEVDSLRLAVVKLSRYEFSKKNGKILYLDDVEQEILQSIVKHNEFIKLSSNAYHTLIAIRQSGENSKFTCSNERLAYSIDPQSKTLKEAFNINIFASNSPFYSSFAYNEIFYHNLKIPSIFIKKACSVISYLLSNKIHFDASNIHLEKHFSSKFVDFKLQKKEFGQSSKVIIFEQDMDLIIKEMIYLQKFTNELLICIPKKYSKYMRIKEFISFSNELELLNILKQNFRYVLVLGEKLIYKNLFLPKTSNQKSFF